LPPKACLVLAPFALARAPFAPMDGIPPSAYRLPDGLSLGRVVLQVADLKRSLDFYQSVLGLRPLEHSEGRSTLGAHGGNLPLVELRERAGASPVPRGGRIGLYHFAILLPDRPALGRFVTHLSGWGFGLVLPTTW